MTWIRLMVHWIVSDYNLGKVSVYTLRKDCVGLRMHVVGSICVWNFGGEGENVKPRENLIF